MPRPARIGLLSTFPPTQCGLASFTAALLDELAPGAGVVRVVERAEPVDDGRVVGELVAGSRSSARAAAELLDRFDVAVVQHEYGIYGGQDGLAVLDVVDLLAAPVVVVLHTVLRGPTARQRHILERLLERADLVVTMTRTASERLVSTYAADPARLAVIPHGAWRSGVPTAAPLPDPRLPGRRPLVLTWGLLGPGKGIEWAVDALPGLRDLDPRYLVSGQTHPKVLERDGEAYRDGLRRRIAARGVEDLVELDERYLSTGELARLVASADVVLLPYDSEEQVTSGVLTEAVAAGRPVVSTAFPHAVELLTGGPGLVVPRQDPRAIELALRRVLTEPGLAAALGASAADRAAELSWAAVAERYQRAAGTLVAARARTEVGR
ncbi:glycosyltransferase involved in cell wall biosynthesis [Motilibacter rhizosphaerae]|uniref:Glycosyltransferase involved in cell wall biosynthesis n=1 Tax=Motilibacter rhizosphaerae TaxID=598652 RepID=A0A4Q7NWS5_9ACTN|nr:glycosyltransferase [Motilibacter rhizosphaerae]RZS91644.1 glycosyltransferase involved in cell wall biosynthesis [Motilibacter rhizosphaerae]